MTTESQKADSDQAVQEHCIDLPGESVQCWIGGGTDKLKVILRKHRDVIFDIHLGNGKTYTLETTESDFYNARDKKLVYAAQHGKVAFKDGERMHVWVSRGFRGALILKCGDHVMSAVKPNEWDTQHHSDDPKEKPAPIIVAIANHASTSNSSFPAKLATPTAPHPAEQTVHVHEVSKEKAPPVVLKYFEDGGESLDLDSDNIVTRNWIASQVFGVGAYVFDNHTWITDLKGCKFYLQKVNHKLGPKVYIVFTGNNKVREVMSASRYSMQHTKIVRITGGAGSVKQQWDAAKGAVKDTFKVIAREEGKFVVKGGGVALVLAIGMDAAEWYKDYSEAGPDGNPKKDLLDLFAKLGTDLVKAGLVAGLTTVTIAAIFSGLAVFGVALTAAAAPVILVVVGTIIVSAGWTYLIELGDRSVAHALKEDDITALAVKKFREIADSLHRATKDVRYEDYAALPM